MARLICVPVMHGTAETGAAEASDCAAFVALFGEPNRPGQRLDFDAIWRAIEDAIAALALDLAKVKIYQDSLPVCGDEVTLIEQLAEQDSRNHQLVARLLQRGAGVIGTESPALLLEEYRLLQSANGSGKEAALLLEKRDRFIARRIADTLRADETGILFIGALRQVMRFLPPAIAPETLTIDRWLTR